MTNERKREGQMKDYAVQDQLEAPFATSSTSIVFLAECVRDDMLYTIEFGKDLSSGKTQCYIAMRDYTGDYDEDGRPEYDYEEVPPEDCYFLPDGCFDFDSRRVLVTNQETEEAELVHLVHTDDLADFVELNI